MAEVKPENRKRPFRNLSPEHAAKIAAAMRGRKKSPEHCKNISIAKKMSSLKGEKSHCYKGDNVGYVGIHTWLKKNFERPSKCEICGVAKALMKNSLNMWNIVWAKRRDCSYERKRENFIGLCHRCHRIYDRTDEWNEKISQSKKGINNPCFGKKLSAETRLRISLSNLGKKKPRRANRSASSPLTPNSHD